MDLRLSGKRAILQRQEGRRPFQAGAREIAVANVNGGTSLRERGCNCGIPIVVSCPETEIDRQDSYPQRRTAADETKG